MSRHVVVVDYGMGNLLSVQRGFQACDAEVEISSDVDTIVHADRLILPGVGAFKDGMHELKKLSLNDAIQEFVKTGRPLLGICLGMQMLLDESEEYGINKGLGFIPGRVVQIPRNGPHENSKRKIPHIGWSAIKVSEGKKSWDGTVLQDVAEGEYFYFVHSFRAEPQDSCDVLAVCEYEAIEISAVIERENVTGCQFHPEKSGQAGLSILRRFLYK